MREIKNNKQGDKVSQWTYSCGERSHEDGTFEYGLLYHDMLSYLQSTTVVRYKKNYGSSVMEYRSSRIQNNIMVRNDVRSIPAFSSIINLQHMIRHVLSKAKLIISDLRLWVLGALNNNIVLLYIITEL